MQEKKDVINQMVIAHSNNGNYYIQDIINNQSIYIHPELYKYLSIHNTCQKEIILSSDSYYKKKYEFLKKYVLANQSSGSYLTPYINKEVISENIINTQQLLFEVTDECNLQCKYCGYGDLYSGYDERTNKSLEWETAKVLIDFFINKWTEGNYPSVGKPIAIGFYGGEPLLNIKLIKKIIQYLEANAPEKILFQYHMTTNGMLIDKNVDYLIEKEINIAISLDGDKKSQMYRVNKRGENSFEKVTQNIQIIIDKAPEYFTKYVHFISVLHNKNSMQLIINYFKSKYNKIPTILEVTPSGVLTEKKEEFNRLFKSKRKSIAESDNIQFLKELLFTGDPDIRTLVQYIHQYTGNVIKDYPYFFKDINAIKYLPTGTCLPFGKRVFLTVNGKILPCERIDHQYEIGRVKSTGVIINPDEIASNHTKHYERIISQCSVCYNQKTCNVCIFSNKDIMQKGKCDSFVNEQTFQKSLSKILTMMEESPTIYNKIMKEVILEN